MKDSHIVVIVIVVNMIALKYTDVSNSFIGFPLIFCWLMIRFYDINAYEQSRRRNWKRKNHHVLGLARIHVKSKDGMLFFSS